MLVMPADYWIDDVDAFSQAISQAEKTAFQGMFVTFGIKPSFPETGYGCILADGNMVQKFVENPDKETAEQHIASGNCFWNSGMFCMRAGSLLRVLSFLAPDIAEQASKSVVAGAKQSSGDNWQELEVQRADYERIPSISVDYAVFEESQSIAIVPCDLGWSDMDYGLSLTLEFGLADKKVWVPGANGMVVRDPLFGECQ